MIKVSIQCGVMDKIEKGDLKYNQKLIYRDSLPLLYALNARQRAADSVVDRCNARA